MNIKKLFFILMLIVASNSLQASRKATLMKHRANHTLKKEKEEGLITKKSEFLERKAKLKLQRKSNFSRLYHLANSGIRSLVFGSLYGCSSYWLMGESCDENNTLFKRGLAGFCAITTGYLAVLCGFKGARSINNNVFHWHERKFDKITINQKALKESKKEDKSERICMS